MSASGSIMLLSFFVVVVVDPFCVSFWLSVCCLLLTWFVLGILMNSHCAVVAIILGLLMHSRSTYFLLSKAYPPYFLAVKLLSATF